MVGLNCWLVLHKRFEHLQILLTVAAAAAAAEMMVRMLRMAMTMMMIVMLVVVVEVLLVERCSHDSVLSSKTESAVLVGENHHSQLNHHLSCGR